MFFSYFIDGFAYAAEAMVGKEGVYRLPPPTGTPPDSGGEYLWQKTPEVVRCVKVLSAWSVALGLVFSVLFFVFDEGLIAMMTTDADIQTAAVPYYLYLWLMPLLSAFAFMFDGVFIGATMGVPVRNCMFYSAAAFVLTYIAAAPMMGAAAMYLAYMVHLIIRTVYLAFAYAKL